MKSLLISLVTLSLIGNALLGYVYLHNVATTRTAARTTTVGTNHSATKSSGGAAGFVAPDLSFGTSPTATVVDPALTAALKSGDLRTLPAALRAAGFPEKYIRNIEVWQLADLTADRRDAKWQEIASRPFWRAETRVEKAANDKALDDLDAKKLDLTKEIFEGDVPPPPDLVNLDLRRLAFLPLDKLPAVNEVVNKYIEIRRVAALALRVNPEGAAAKANETNQAMHAEIATLLTPAELELYDLNVSPSAQVLRSQMQAFEPTEQEFRAMYSARSGVDQAAGGADRQAADAALNEQYRAILGEDRFAEFQRAQNRDYRVAFQVVQHFQLPPESAGQVYDLRQSATQRLQEIRQNSDPNAVRTATQALTQEVNAQLTQLLGAQGADAYAKMGGASWAQTSPSPATPVPAGAVRLRIGP